LLPAPAQTDAGRRRMDIAISPPANGSLTKIVLNRAGLA
jgi:hypothetical protein